MIDSSSILLVSKTLRRELGRFSPGGAFARRVRAADALILAEIAERRRAPDLEERTDVLSLLLGTRDGQGHALTDTELRDELITLLAAGHETTATGLSFALELLMRTPQAMARTRDELTGENPRAWLDAVGKEALRLRPVLDAAERKLMVPRTVAGWHLPAGVKVYPAIALVHHREDLYEHACEFRPERFLGGAESYSWLPFGGGIRRCIGAAFAQAEMTEVLKVVLDRAELEPVRPEPDPVVLKGVTLVPKHGVPTRVTRVAQRPRPARTAWATADSAIPSASRAS